LITLLEITASNEPSSKGSSSIRARSKLTCPSRRRRSDLASCSGVMSTPVTEPSRPTCDAAAKHVHAGAAVQIKHPLAREQTSEAE
jgi:hypothetical protein